MSEKEQQKLCVEYAKALNFFVYAIPAVKFSKQQGGFPIGYKKGMPDLCVPELSYYHETKDVKAGKVKEHAECQDKIHQILREAGCTVSMGDFEVFKENVDRLIELLK